MVNYRDYGAMNGTGTSNVEINTIHYSQVYTATHDGAGARLPYMNRSFISFSWGGKNIEDFDLLAIIENNSLQRKLYADFEDNVTESNIWDGQIYWSSHYNANSISFALFTDGITENQLGEFKHYFQPGRIEELILAENPNRAIYARISKPPEYSILPFEKKITIKIGGHDYDTSTTLYKGRINLEFIMDEPFWHSRANILDRQEFNGEYVANKWIDANGQEAVILSDKDALKVLVEDGIPMSMMLRDETISPDIEIPQVYFGTEHTIAVDTSMGYTGSRISTLPSGLNANIRDYGLNMGAAIDYGHIAFVLITFDSTIDLSVPSVISNNDEDIDTVNSCGYFYYAGTAPCAPIIQFMITPVVGENGYIIFPRNSYGTTSGNKFNTIIIQSKNKKRFTFTTPGIYTGYNQVIKILKNASTNIAWEEVRAEIRDNVKHWAPRAYAISVINSVKENSNTTRTTRALLNECVTNMYNFLLSGNDTIATALYTIDCKTGRGYARFIFRNTSNTPIYTNENIGDMIRSNYLVMDERNYPTEDGYIEPWTNESPTNSYRIYSDAALTNLNLQYRYLYL